MGRIFTGTGALVSELKETGRLSKDNFIDLIENREAARNSIGEEAAKIRRGKFGNTVFKRALIECTNHCANNCSYCGIRRDNKDVSRYRLSKEDILQCCARAEKRGFKTFVLQGGEDPAFTADFTADVISEIRARFPECAITLSLGERDDATYRQWKRAGANRYLLRHESADAAHYRFLHAQDAPERTIEKRKACLASLKKNGYQTGSGFMVGSPGQTAAHIAEDLLFLAELRPEMVGIGPFIPHTKTPFARHPGGTAELTTFLLSVIRIMLPDALLPSTTALATIEPDGRERGILAGANVVMPNISPADVRKKYEIYQNKISENAESAEGLSSLEKRLDAIGFVLSDARGDFSTDGDKTGGTVEGKYV